MFKSMLCRLMLIVGVLLSSPQFISAQSSPHVPGELLIAPKTGVSEADLENQYKAHGGKKIKTLSRIKVHHIKVPDHALEAIEAALRKNPKVEYVEKNFVAESFLTPNDPSYSSQWHLAKISAPQAWDLTTGSSSVIVAIIDSGVDPFHPDLTQVPGYNFVASNADTSDTLGHGTAVAGAASASCNNGIGLCGVTWNNPVMPLVVMSSSGSGSSADVANAIIYAADRGAKVINMSFGWIGYSETAQAAVNYAWNKGLVMVAAAGNSGNSTAYTPAFLNNVLAVSATDGSDNLASWSTYGDWIDVAAPGAGICTTATGGGYWCPSGTSVASPVVAGLAALLFSLNPSLSNSQVVDLITNNSDDIGASGFDSYYGKGRINAYRSVSAALGIAGPPPPPPPPPSTPPPPPLPPPPGDTTPPTVQSVTTQYDGKWLSVAVSASDDASGVARVEIYVDGKLQATDTVQPYTFKFNTKPWPKGNHGIQLKVYDAAGNANTSALMTVTTN